MAIGGGYGLGPWGISPWGIGTPPPVFIVSAIATSERTVEVTFSAPPQQISPILEGDALNPAMWSVLAGDEPRLVLTVAAPGAPDATVFTLYTLEKLRPFLIEHVVAAPLIRDSFGNPMQGAVEATFAGCAYVPPARSPRALVDIANVPASPTELSGTYVVGSDGDYTVEAGISFLRKLIYRRLITAPGEFFWLPNTYGIGLRVKEPLGSSSLVKLQAVVQNQLKQEPEFADVLARLTLGPNGILTVTVTATLASTNQQVVVPVAVATQNVSTP